MSTAESAPVPDAERADLLETLGVHRHFLRHTLRGLTDEQAALTPTVSQLCLGGLVKHLTRVERSWLDFVLDRPGDLGGGVEEHEQGFRMLPGDTVADLLADYERAARETDEAVATVEDLDASHPLPPAPWFAPGARRSNRRVFLHLIAETAQHAGHADIIREAIDGSKTMG
jgi:uncharacterized damage-inducible protein DinB